MKKSLITIMIAVISLSICLGFTGCQQGDNNSITETVSESTVQTTTNDFPSELSTELAKSILINARTTSLFEVGYKAVGDTRVYLSNGDFYTAEKTTYIYNENNTVIQSLFESKVKMESGNYETYSQTYITRIGNSYYELTNHYKGTGYYSLDTKTARTIDRDSIERNSATSLLISDNITGDITQGLIFHVIGGRYCEGKTIVTSYFNLVTGTVPNQQTIEITAEYTIENNHIVAINVTYIQSRDSAVNYPAITVSRFEYSYGVQTINNLPTSLQGYTLS